MCDLWIHATDKTDISKFYERLTGREGCWDDGLEISRKNLHQFLQCKANFIDFHQAEMGGGGHFIPAVRKRGSSVL